MNFPAKSLISWGLLIIFCTSLTAGCSNMGHLNPFSQQSTETNKNQQVEPTNKAKPVKKSSIRVEAAPQNLPPSVIAKPPAPLVPKQVAKHDIHSDPKHKCNEICELPLKRKPFKP